MGEKRGKGFGILVVLIGLLVIVNTSLILTHMYSEDRVLKDVDSEDQAEVKIDSSTSRTSASLTGTKDKGKPDNEERVSLLSSRDEDDDDASSESFSDDDSDDSSEDDDDSDSQDDEDDVEYGLDPVPENKDGPEAESVEGKDLDFNFGIGGIN